MGFINFLQGPVIGTRRRGRPLFENIELLKIIESCLLVYPSLHLSACLPVCMNAEILAFLKAIDLKFGMKVSKLLLYRKYIYSLFNNIVSVKMMND